MARPPRPEAERFLAKISIDPSSGCWNWQAKKSLGYGRFRAGAPDFRTLMAHRWSYEFFVGPIPEDREIDHLCFNKGCVNPDHLEAVTHQINTLRRSAFYAA